MSAYSESKYALESFSDCLRRELIPWGLRVSIIEPGFIRTLTIEGSHKSYEDFWLTFSKDVQARWGEEFLKEQYNNRATDIFIKYAEDPMKVVRALQHAVMNTKPYIRYRPGWQSNLIFFPLSMIPTWIIDLIMIKFNRSTLLPASVYKQLKDWSFFLFNKKNNFSNDLYMTYHDHHFVLIVYQFKTIIETSVTWKKTA
jgi:short-subunit dehydrogenase